MALAKSKQIIAKSDGLAASCPKHREKMKHNQLKTTALRAPLTTGSRKMVCYSSHYFCLS